MTQEIKAFLEADALRTQGEWDEWTVRVKKDPEYPYNGEKIEFNGVFYVREDLVKAPDIAKMVEDMRVAKEALEFYRDFSFSDGGNKAIKALTRLEPYEKMFEKEGER